MTVLVAIDSSVCADRPEEQWHGATMRNGLLSRVVTMRRPDGAWSVRARLLDRALHPVGGDWTGEGYATYEAALRAGEAAAMRLHKGLVGIRGVPSPTRTILDLEPAGGYQSQALRRLAQALRAEQPAKVANADAKRAVESEKIA